MIIEETTDLGSTRIVRGTLENTGGQFTCYIKGDGNSAEYRFEFTGGQYDMDGEPLVITVIGEWEAAEVAEVLNMMTKTPEVDMLH